MVDSRRRPTNAIGKPARQWRTAGNQILKLLPVAARELIAPSFEIVERVHGQVLFEPGDDVAFTYFPLNSALVSLVLPMRDGRVIEATTVGREGAIGGFVSSGYRPAFARAVVRISGQIARIPTARLEASKRAAPRLQDTLARYCDCLYALVLQSAACATLHSLEARCARWLLMTHDRVQLSDLPLTQEMLAEALGVSRTYMTRIARRLQRLQAIAYRRGTLRIERRDVLEKAACECYGAVRRHFDGMLPGLYPRVEP